MKSANQMKLSLVTSLLVVAGGLAQTAFAATITHVGEDQDTGVNWRVDTTDKPDTFDPDGDDIYGSDGWAWAKSPYTGSSPFSGGDATIVASLPSYIASVGNNGGTFWAFNYTDFGTANDPTTPSTFEGNAGQVQGGETWTFTLAEDVTFLVGIIANTHNSASQNPTAIGIRQTNGDMTDPGTVAYASGLSVTEVSYAFFQISGSAGDAFVVYGSNGGSATANATGLSFEAVPEPTSHALLGLGGLCLLGGRRRSA